MRGFDPTNYKPPGQYPAAFGNTVLWRDSGLLHYADFPWTKRGVKVRFRLFITTLRHEKLHPYHSDAVKHEWRWMEMGEDSFRIVGVPKELAKKA